MKLIDCLAQTKQKAFRRLSEWTSDEAYCTYWCISILACQGLWPGKKMRLKTTRTIYMRTTALVGLYFCLIVFPVGVYVHWRLSVSIVIEEIACFFLFGAIVIYIWCFHFRFPKYEKVITSMEAMLQYGRLYNDHPEKIRNQTKLLSDLSVGSLIFYNLLAAIILGAQVPTLRARKIFVFNGWFPSIFSEPPLYEAMLLISTTFLFSGGLILTSSIAFLISLFVQAIGQFKLLNHNLLAVLPHVQRKLQMSSTQLIHSEKCHSQTLNYQTLPTSGKINFSRLNHYTNRKLDRILSRPIENLLLCIRHHQKIIRFIREIETSFQHMLVIQCVGCVVPAVLGTTIVFYAEEFNLKMLMIIIIITVITLNLALFCLLADITSTQNEIITDTVYETNWLDASSADIRSSLRIVMMRANQPIHIKVAGFVPLSNQTFFNILRLTYSYFISMTTYLNKPVH